MPAMLEIASNDTAVYVSFALLLLPNTVLAAKRQKVPCGLVVLLHDSSRRATLVAL
jgi:hypothetical protein